MENTMSIIDGIVKRVVDRMQYDENCTDANDIEDAAEYALM